METLNELLVSWEQARNESDFNPVPLLTKIAELIEQQTEAYLKLPIDPFDDRHPSRSYPECTLGTLLKTLFKNETFMNQLTINYIEDRSLELHIICSRLLLDILPGLDARVVFLDTDNLISKLLSWADEGPFPLNYYATGLLAAAMEVDEIANSYREKNQHLVPLMFNRLSQITKFDDINLDPGDLIDVCASRKRSYSELEDDEQIHNECSSSSWAEVHMSGSYQMHPLSTVMQQRFILQYLATLGDYQELLVHMFEHKALSYILYFIDGRRNQDIRLAFDALKFLAAFLTHKKFALEFLDHGGLNQLLRVNKRSMASAGVSICLYYLACSEDVLEKICWMKRQTVETMIEYGLKILQTSHDTSKAHASMFFSHCFQFPLLLKLFDRLGGLRALLNFLVLGGMILQDESSVNELSDDEIFSKRQTAKHVCMALKKYIRAHFLSANNDQECKPVSLSDENVMEAVESHRNQSLQRNSWRAIDKFMQDEGISHLLRIIAQYYNEGIFFAGRNETVRSALEVLVVSSLSPRVQQLILREKIRTTIPFLVDHPALAVIVMSADTKVQDAETQKSALNILINLVSSNHPTRLPSLELCKVTPGSGRKKNPPKNLVDQLRKGIWACKGTLILPKLLTVTSPLTEADTIRLLACRVLCGLAREESIRQVMSKLPLFTDGQLQSLMKPILAEKAIENASFCRYCKELIKLVTGTPVTLTYGMEPSLSEIKRRMVVAQTKIEYDKVGADHLIHNYLNSRGCPEIAAAFYKFANLSTKSVKVQNQTTLDSIFTEYLRNQHSLCKNPVAICPPFELLEPHRCPEPKDKFLAPQNIVSRVIRRKVYPPKGGIHGSKYDRHYIYSKFRPVRLVRDSEISRTSSTCCAFSRDGQYLYVGTEAGTLKAFNINTGIVEVAYNCHASALGYIEANHEDNLLITTCPDSTPNPHCTLWKFNEVHERKQKFENDVHAEFGKATSNRIITTHPMYARLFDTTTGSLLYKYDGHHRYSSNRATLNYNDTLVLNDGILWDVRLPGSCIHTFDKFNEHINGIFHHNGNEIIYNSQIWDIRNFRLTRDVKEFDMCQLKFNSMGDVIFSTILDDQSDDTPRNKSEFKTSFRTFDSSDYSTISTIDLKKTISDLAVSKGDRYIGLVESSGNTRCFQEDYMAETNVCRLYEVGRPTMADDDDDDADDEENDDDDEDDDEEDMLDDYDEEDYEDMYDDDDDDEADEEDEDEDEDASGSHLSSSTSRDELLQQYFLPNSPDDDDDEEDLSYSQ